MAVTTSQAADTAPIRWAVLARHGECSDIASLREFRGTPPSPMTLEALRIKLGAGTPEPVQVGRLGNFSMAYQLPVAGPPAGAFLVVPLAECPKQQ